MTILMMTTAMTQGSHSALQRLFGTYVNNLPEPYFSENPFNNTQAILYDNKQTLCIEQTL